MMKTTAFAALGAFLLIHATVIGYGLLIAGAVAMQNRAKRKARDKYNASQVDRLQSIATTTAPRELVLGRVRKGGAVIFRDSCGSHNEKFVMVVVLASHKIDGVEKYYLNDKEVTLDASGNVLTEPYRIQRKTSTVTSEVVPGSCYAVFDAEGQSYTYCQYYAYESKANIRIYDGSQTTADSRLMSLFPDVWTANHKLLGVAYAIIELDYDESAFPSGIPSLTVLLRGAQVYDPRSGQTVFSENPALHARHIITHPRFGKRSSLTAREDARIIAAANACDTVYTPSGGSATTLYKSGVVFPYGGQAADALDDLCQGMCGMWAYAGGEFFIKVGVYTAPVKTLSAADLLTTQSESQGGSTSKAILINTHRARAEKINSVTAKIYDSGADYKETTITPVKAEDAIAKGGKELPIEMSLPTVSSASQASVVCNYMLKDSFDPLAITANFKLSAYELELFDNVALNIPRYGWSSKVFTVLSKNFSPTGAIEMTLRETSAELFNPLVYADSDGYADNTNLVEPWDINDLGVLTISSGTSELLLQGDGSLITRVRVQWSPILDERIRQGGYVEVRWKDVSSETWSTVSVPGVESSTYLLGAVDGSTIVVLARTRTQLAVSDWNVQKTHLVLGKSEPPAAVSVAEVQLSSNALTLKWEAITDLDVAGYEVRTSDTGWGSAGALLRGNALSIGVTPIGNTSSWFIRAYDRSGNYSTTSKSVNFVKAAIPAPSGLAASVNNKELVLSWQPTVPEFGVRFYEVRESDSGWGSSGEVYRGTATSVIVTSGNPGAIKTWFVRVVDSLGAYGSTATASFTKVPITQVSSALANVDGQKLALYWPDTVTQFTLAGYEVRESDSGWGLDGEIYKGQATLTEVVPTQITSTWYVKAYDVFGHYSTLARAVSYTVPEVAKVSDVTHVFADTSLTAATVTLSWKDAVTTFGYDYYEISYNGTAITVKANTVTVPANWIGNRDFSIVTVDRFGFKSSALVYPVTKLAPAKAINFRAQVLGNNVLLYWTLPAKTSLPIAHSRVRKGATWASAEEVGTKDGEFTSIFELSGGEFQYWLAVIDTDGYESEPVSLTAAVTQPPDFLFLGEQTSTFSATKVNAKVDVGALVLPINLTETFEEHFTGSSWASPSAQVSAGYPIYIQPGLASGYYEEIFDFGTVVASSSVTVVAAGVAVSGDPTRLLTVSLSDDQVDWTVYSGYSQVFATNFRYVKVRFDVTRKVVGDIYRLEQLTVRLDTKTFTDSGTVNAIASDVGGTAVNFNFEVLDVLSINTTVNSTAPRTVGYTFRDATKTATYSVTSGVATLNFSTPHELKSGQAVRIATTSGTLARGVYTIASVVNANSFTVAVSNPNTSGGCVSYPNSFTVYVFDSAGVRQSNTVSWNMRGS